MPYRFQLFTQLAICGLLLSCLGCLGGDSNVGKVEGVVNVDGAPVERAVVSFYPTSGRASQGVTDAEGHYTLTYTSSTDGAVIGKHKVVISTKVEREVEYGDSDYANGGNGKTPETVISKARKEMLPKKYCDLRATELTATVESGSNTINFDLQTKTK